MSLQVRYNSATEVADVVTVRQGVAFSSAAEEGAVAQSQIVVDDTGSTLDYVGLRRLYAYETAAQAHNQMIYNGYLQERTIGRKPAEGQDQDEAVTALDRRWTLTVADTNSLLSRRLITGADGDRPAETDVARIQWLLDSNDAYLSNPQDTWENPSPYIETDYAVDMDAADLRGQTAFDVLNDCAQRSGKNWFARYYEAADSVPPTNNGSIALWYAFDYGTSDTSSLRLTNVNAEADQVTTFYVLPDALLSVDPSRNYSGLLVNGQWYFQSTNVENLFQRRDAAVNNPNVKTYAKAEALATRYLADAASEDRRISCRFIVAKQYVNDLREGQRLQVKFSHFTGYETFTYVRCLRRTVTQLDDEFYEIAIEASAPAPSADIVQSYSYRTGDGAADYNTFAAPVTAGNLLVLVIGHRGDVGWDFGPKLNNSTGPARPFTQWGGNVYNLNDPMGVFYRIATGDEQVLYMEENKLQWTMYEISGAGDPSTFEVLSASAQASSGTKSLGSFTGASTGDIQIAGFILDDDDTSAPDQTVGAGWTQDQQRKDLTTGKNPLTLQMHASTHPAVSISGVAHGWGAIAVNIESA